MSTPNVDDQKPAAGWARVVGALAATAMLAGALLAWAIVTPGYRGPDEPQHVSTVIQLGMDSAYPPPGTSQLDTGVRGGYAWFGFPGASDYTAINVEVGPPPTDPAPSVNDLRAAGAIEADAELTNQITQHPPLYYVYLAGVFHLFGLADAPVTAMLVVLRLASALLLLPIPAIILATCTRVGLPATTGLLAAFVPAAWVQFTHIGSVVNNGTLLALASTVALAMMVRVVGGDLRVRIAVVLGVAIAAALLTKAYALALLPLAVFAYAWRWRADRTRIWRPMLIGAAVAAIGLSWYIYVLVRFGTLQPTSEGVSVTFAWKPLLSWIPEFLHALSSSMWLNLGWLETPLRPPPLHYAVSLVALALMGLGTWALRRRVDLIVLLHGAWVLPLLIFAYGSARHWLWNETIRAAQGRYLQMAVLALIVLIAAAVTWPRWMVILMPAAAAVAVAGGLGFGLRHFWETPSPLAAAAAWPGGLVLVVLAGILVAGGAATGTIAAVRTPRTAVAAR